MGLLLYAVIVLLFAVWLSIHLRLCVRLLSAKPHLALVGLVVPPYALYLGHKRQIPVLPSLWLASFFFYAVALLSGFVA